MRNQYIPKILKIVEIKDETRDTRTLKLTFIDKEVRENFHFIPGQFGEFSVFGAGEAPLSIASSPTEREYIECCFRVVGRVTKALRDLEVGDLLGFRGPFGNGFPIENIEGKNLLFIGGGIGIIPLRSLILYCLDIREKFGEIRIVYGARTVGDIVFKNELTKWERRDDVEVVKTVDPGGETPDWDGKVGLVPHVLEEYSPPSKDSFAFVCGPPIMIKFTLPVLEKLGFSNEEVFTTLENKMKCGIGKCGRCNVGRYYVCKDGPVFSASQLLQMPEEY